MHIKLAVISLFLPVLSCSEPPFALQYSLSTAIQPPILVGEAGFDIEFIEAEEKRLFFFSGTDFISESGDVIHEPLFEGAPDVNGVNLDYVDWSVRIPDAILGDAYQAQTEVLTAISFSEMPYFTPVDSAENYCVFPYVGYEERESWCDGERTGDRSDWESVVNSLLKP